MMSRKQQVESIRGIALNRSGIDKRSVLRLRSFHAAVSFLLFVAILAFPSVPVRGQGFCGTPDGPPGGSGGGFPPYVEAHGTLRALVIFADFSDGLDATLCETTSWPPAAAFPAWRDSLVEDTLTPTIDVSMTRYFDLLSSGQHKLMGRVHDTVIRVDNTIQWYAQNHPYHAWQYAAGNVIDQAMAQLGSEATDFDYDNDDYIDAVFIYFRQFKSTAGDYYINRHLDGAQEAYATGVANLFPATELQRSYVVGSRTLYVSRYRGVLMTTWDRASTGGGYDRSLIGALRVANHEYGHLLNYGTPVHPSHIGSMGPYSLMNDAGQGAILEAYVRHKLDWFNPPLVPIIADTTVVLGATLGGTGGNAVIVATADPRQFFALEVRDSTANRYLLDSGVAGCRPHRQQSGLLITHVREGGVERWNAGDPGLYPPFEDPEIATGMFAEDRRPDPVLGKDALHDHGVDWFFSQPTDLFRDDAATATVFAPYTNPSTNLYPPYNDEPGVSPPADQSVYSGIHFYNIHWKNPAIRDSMVVSIRFDGTTPPSDADTVAVDTTWEGVVQVTGDVVVAEGATLTIKEGTKVIAAAEQDAFSAGRDEGRVEISAAGTIDLQGSATEPILFASSRDPEFVHWCAGSEYTTCPGEMFAAAPGDWFGIRTSDLSAKVLGQHVILKHALGALSPEETPAALPSFTNLTSRGFAFEENSSDVSFDRDVLIAALDSVTVPAGWRLGFGPGDAVNQGRDPGRAELIVRGDLAIQGVAGDRVRLGAMDPAVGPWAGLLFDQLASAPNGYGYCESYVNNADIAHATTGIAIRQSGAPSLVRPVFEDIEDNRDVVLDSSDVYVPKDGVWELLAPTTIKIALATRSGAEIGSRNPGKVDIVVHGLLQTSGLAPDFVKFEPVQVPTEVATGEEWGGVLIDWPAPFSPPTLFSHADVGYAITPIWSYFHRPVIEHSRIHHFRDQAVRLQYSPAGVGPELRYNSVFRDTTGTATLDQAVGKVGVVLNNVPDGNIQENTISLSGMQDGGGSALFVQNTAGKFGFCATTGSGDTLQVVGNHLQGPGGEVAIILGAWSGLSGDWMCGVSGRKVFVTDNVIDGWNEAGIKLNQSADLQFTCNTVTNCAKALEFTRNSDPEGSVVRFRANTLEIGEYGGTNDQAVLRTDHALSLKLGPTVDKGKNQIIADGADRYVLENDSSTNTLNAERNYWQRAGGPPHTQTWEILEHVDTEISASVLVSVASPEGTAPDLCSSSATQPIAPETRAEGVVTPGLVGDGSESPTRTELSVLGPFVGHAEIRFALAGPEACRVDIEVFNVVGRRVTKLVGDQLIGGRYGIRWDGSSETGERVAAGVYLVRLQAGDIRDVRKLVLLR